MQTLAILLDTYRELNAKRLFWITMVISTFVVLGFAAVGLNETGLTILWWEIPAPFNSQLFTPAAFYKVVFVNLGIGFWLTWLATILALVSTSGMIPDFLQGGAIELSLSKPIGRVRLLLTKFVAGLLFVALQVGVFSLASFLVIGIRGGAWEPGIFLAIPIVLVFFSYLYSVCLLIGLVTRSTIASLILTLLFWFAIFGVHTTETVMSQLKLQSDLQVEGGEKELEKVRGQIKELSAQAAGTSTAPATPAAEAEPEPTEGGLAAMAAWALRKGAADAERSTGPEARLAEAQQRQEQIESRLERRRTSRNSVAVWHSRILLAKTVLPKTSETIGLLERSLISKSELDEMMSGDGEGPVNVSYDPEGFEVDQRELARRSSDLQRSRPVWWVVGTSLLFEAAVLGLACWIFVRRDF